MAHRSFADSGGRQWEVWDVFPQRVERRVAADRRTRTASDRRSQDDRREAGDRRRRLRRSTADRRITARQATRLPRTYIDGWLCFECAEEKRRLVPVPSGWDRLSDDELARLLESARLARTR